MKQIRTLLLTATITLAAFSAIVYTSCSKNKCSGVNCQNGGACSGGVCSCPTGYSGNFCELSSIIFQNNAYTPVYITVNSTQGTIPAGASVAFVGTAGANANVTATTQGAYGSVYTWTPFTDAFPTGGYPLTETFDISSDYFYLQITNNDAYGINGLYVNYGLPAQTFETPSLSSYGTYGIGYYLAYGNTKVSVNFTGGGTYTTSNLAIPNTIDASYTVTIP